MAGFSDKFMHINRILGSSNKVKLKHYLYELTIILFATIILSGVLVLISKSIIQNYFGFDMLENNQSLIFLIVIISNNSSA